MIMMDFNELEIGDWVTSDQEDWQWKRTDYYFINSDNYIIYISPVVLTEEMLILNGFEKVIENETKSSEGVISFELMHRDVDGEYPIFSIRWANIHNKRVINTGFRDIANDRIKYDYVYQLQHALKLCGLKELAINFKIKQDN